MSEVENGYGHLPDGNEEDGDVCRVCRAEGDDDDPLIYPCKCSGSVRFVHPMCLKDWLAHSHKRYCEICGHRYTFTKIYTDYIPVNIPKVVFVRQTILWLYRMTGHVHRFILAVLGWLIILPSLNLVTLRTLIWIADTSISYPTGIATSNPLAITPYNTTAKTNGTEVNETTSRESNVRVRDMFMSPVAITFELFAKNWRGMYRLESDSISGFVFRGQILSVTLAAVLVGLLFFREWMNQQNLADFMPPPPTQDEPINLDEWVVQRGVARRVDEVDRMKETNAAVAALLATRRPDAYRTQAERLSRRAARRARRAAAHDAQRVDLETPEEADPEFTSPGPQEIRVEVELTEGGPITASPSVSDSSRSPSSADQPESSNPGPSRPRGPPPGPSSVSASDDESAPNRLPDDHFTRRRPRRHSSSRSSCGYSSGDPILDASPIAGPSSPDTLPRPCELGEAGPSVSTLAYTAPEMLKERGKEQAVALGEPRLVFVDFGARDKSGKRYFPTTILPEARPAALAMARLNKWPVELKFDGHEVEESDRGEKIIDVSNSESRGEHGLETGEEVWHEFMDRALDYQGEVIQFEEEPGSPVDDRSDGYVTVDDEVGSGERSPRSSDDDVPRPRRPSTPGPRVGVLRRGDEPETEEPEEAQAEPVQIPAPRPEVERPMRDPEDIDGLEEDIPWEREDWDGVLEVVGLIGPLSNLFQNIAFAITIMGVALTVLVGFPIVTGKVVLALDVIKSAFVICQLLLRGVRVLTDPVLDVVFEISKEVVILPLWSSFQALERIVATRLNLTSSYKSAFGDFLGDSTTDSISWSSFVTTIDSSMATMYRLQREISLHLATSPALSDKIWCMLIGYGTVALSIAFIALAGELNMGRISTTVLEGIRHHALFMKLAIFMGVELIIFPLVIGLVIDLCTIPLYEGATISSGLRYMRHSPFGAIFVSWLVGTMFMFTFASFLAHIRGRTRRGALFFIRDPADASFSPVKDILERSTASQFRKLAISAMMYTVVVSVIFGAPCWGLRFQTLHPVLPLRTKSLHPLSSIPFDLLFLHLAIPPALSYIQPYSRFASAWNAYWKFACRTSCLSSLMHGKLHDSHCQRGRPRQLEWVWPILDPLLQRLFGSYNPTATYARVPASDRVALLPPSERRQGGVFVPLTADGDAKDDEGKLRLLKQDQRARTMKRDPKEDYTVIWLPQYWRTRIHVFIGAAVWMVAFGLIVVGLVPILVGRAVFAMFTTEPVHDGYTYMAGALLSCVAARAGSSARKTIMRTGVASRLRRSSMSTRVKRVLLSAFTNVYALSLLYLVIPSLVGVNFELHIGQIWKYGMDTEQIPILHFWDAWAMGNALCSMLVGMRSMFPTAMERGRYREVYNLARLLHAPLWGGIVLSELHRTVLPAIVFLVLPIIAPPIALAGLMALPSRFVGQIPTALLLRFTYPIVTSLILAYALRGLVQDRIVKVRQGIIDAEYEIEERIENYEPAEIGDVKVVEVDGSDGDEDDWEDAE